MESVDAAKPGPLRPVYCEEMTGAPRGVSSVGGETNSLLQITPYLGLVFASSYDAQPYVGLSRAGSLVSKPYVGCPSSGLAFLKP